MTKVLMLGWEFPPLFSGGLGIATHAIVKSLSPLSHIRLIIPNAGSANDLEHVTIIGLNKISTKEINLERLQFALQLKGLEVHRVPVTLSPYHHINEAVGRSAYEILPVESVHQMEAVHEIFSQKEVYGSNVLYKVHLFANLAGELAADGDYNVIHAHDWVTYPAALRIRKISGKPMVLHVHALETDRAGENVRNEIYRMEKEAFEEADRIIAVSEYTKGQLEKHYGIDSSRISVVHNGIEPAHTSRIPHQLKEKLVVFLGRITYQKGPQFLLETADKVSRVYPHVKFVVAGSGDEFSHLLESSAYRRLGQKFIFTGFLSKAKVNELLSMADVYFMPSVSEPFGLTALEAAQHHVPCVISAQSGAAEVMKASLQADFWDTDRYANYIHALLRYNTLGREISEKARVQLDELTWDHAAEKILSVYSRVM